MSNSIVIQNIKIPYATEGVIRTAQLDDTVTPADSVQLAVNMNFDRVGALTSRLGVQKYGPDFPLFSVNLPVRSFGSLQILNNSIVVASYSESNRNLDTSLFAGAVIAAGEAFVNTTVNRLRKAVFWMKKGGTPPGNMTAYIYAATGTAGTNAKPTGSPLATSEVVLADSIGTSYSLVTFKFEGLNRINFAASTTYVVVVAYNNGDGSNYVTLGLNSPSAITGNASYSGDLSTWSAVGSQNLCFYVYGSIPGGSHYLYTQIENEYFVQSGDGSVGGRTDLGAEGRTGVKARYAQFLNYLWRVNGADNTNVATANGGAWGTTLVPAGFPRADFISAGFEGRVWVFDASNDVVYYTDIVQFVPPDIYTLSFDIDVNFIQNFSPQDGQTFTGCFRVPRALLVFKQNSIYRIYGATSVDAYPAYNVGTYSQESIIQAKDGIYFHHSSGFYQFNYDGQPTEISRRIIDFVRAIPLSKYPDIVGVWDQFDAVEWAVGPLTVEGVTFNNCVLRYTISTQVWTIYDYGHRLINSMIVYDDGVRVNKLIGTSSATSGNPTQDVCGTLDTGFTDFGDPIYWEFIDRWRTFTDMYAKSQSISGVNLYSENAAGANMFYQIQKDPVNKWGDIGTVDENNNSLFPNAATDDFDVVRLRVAGFSSGEPVVIHGVEILSVNVKGYDQN